VLTQGFAAKLRLGLYKILDIANIFLFFFIFFNCSIKGKGGRGGLILRNIVGNEGGLGGGYYTIMCNNAPFFRVEDVFFPNTSTHPKSGHPKNTKKSYKHLNNTLKIQTPRVFRSFGLTHPKSDSPKNSVCGVCVCSGDLELKKNHTNTSKTPSKYKHLVCLGALRFRKKNTSKLGGGCNNW